MDERLARTIEALREVGADWAVLSGVDSLAYALGYAPALETGPSPFTAGPSLALVGRDGSAGLLVPKRDAARPREGLIVGYDGFGATQAHPADVAWREAFGELLHRLGVAGRIAVEPATHPAIAGAVLEGSEAADITPALRRQRMTKTEAELVALRRAAAVTAAGQRRFVELLRPGLTELELFAGIRLALESEARGRLVVAGDLVSGRERTAAAGGWPGNRTIGTGDAVLCDLAPRVEGYWGDSCATTVLGPMNEAQERMFAAARRALDHAVATLRPGLTAQAAHRSLHGMVRKAGFDYSHHTGHGIGTAFHEHPRLCEEETAALRPGMVLMVEPGAYDPASGGARTEWMLHITDTGCVPIEPFPLVASTDGAA
jgi:Xaa-Pro dipeptidase